MTTEKSFTRDQVLTSLCVWEELLRRLAEPKSQSTHDGLLSFRDRYGASGLRERAVDLADYVDETYKLVDEGVRDTCTFDWDIVPAILDLVTWSTHGYIAPEPELASGLVSEQLAANTRPIQIDQLESVG